MDWEYINDDKMPVNKWDKLISALKDLPDGKAIKLNSSNPQKDAASIRQRIYNDMGSGKFSIRTNENTVYIKHMD